jgi:hypothetical protein
VKNLREVACRLREILPTVHPVKFRRRPAKDFSNDAWAQCSLIQSQDGDYYFSIIINRSLPWRMVKLLIAHEYAHALSWTVDHPNFEDHGPEFGLAYSKAYQAVFEVS